MNYIYLKLILSLSFSIFILITTNKFSKNYYCLRMLSGYYTLQFLIILIYLLYEPEALVLSTDFPNYKLKENIDLTIIGYFIFQFGILLSALIQYFLFIKRRDSSNLTTLIKTNTEKLTVPLIFSAIVIFTYPLISPIPGIGYVSSILFNYLNFIPFVAGVLFFRNKKIRWIWLVSLLTLFTFGILTGGRGTAMTCAVLFSIGFYYSLETLFSKRLAIITAFVLGIPLIGFMSFVGVYRGIVGRVPLSEITWERAVHVFEKYEKVKDSKVLNLDSETGKLNGVGRLVNFVNILEFKIVPSQRPYEGFESFFNVDLPYAFDLSFLSGSTVEDRLRSKAFAFRLNDYGFYNTLSSSVEYSIVTDSYIRGGFLSVFVFAILVGITTQFFELTLSFFIKKNPAFAIFALIMILQQALLGYAYSYLVILRNMVLAIFAAFVITSAIKFFFILFKQQR